MIFVPASWSLIQSMGDRMLSGRVAGQTLMEMGCGRERGRYRPSSTGQEVLRP
jgi:hypothetical protein